MLLAIVGSSGSGKTTLSEQAFGKENRIITYTTRIKRIDETEQDYHFVSIQQFKKLKNQGFFFETSNYGGNWYGTSKESILQGIKNNFFIIVDMSGYQELKQTFGEDCLGVYIKATASNREKALIERKETTEVVENRLALGKLEEKNEQEFNLVYENDFTDLDKSVESFKQILKERMK